MCGSEHTTTGSTDAPASASEETDLVTNVEKTEHVVMSGDQHARLNDSIKTDKKYTEGVEQFRYLGITLTNKNSVHEEIEGRLKGARAPSVLYTC